MSALLSELFSSVSLSSDINCRWCDNMSVHMEQNSLQQ